MYGSLLLYLENYLANVSYFSAEQARNLTTKQNMPLSIKHYLNNMAKLTNQWNAYNYKEADRQRIYLKDIDCPQVWHDKLKEQIPPGVFYLNETTGDLGGPGSVEEPNSPGPGTRKGRGAARAGDLMSCLPPAMRAENMMCYIGHEGTYTPAHREMCASLGHNIMVETSGTLDEDGKPAKPGSSIWFMTETKDRHLVSEYWLATLGHDIEVESHFAQINAWKAAPFTTYIVEQKVGDFILIPPLAPHQVWNRGTRTMKAAWNRTTVETLEMALKEALPRARMVCRDEQYKNKAIVLFALEKYSGLLKQVDLQKQTMSKPQFQLDLSYNPKIRQLQKDFKRLFSLYSQILLSETLSPVSPTERRGQFLAYDSFVTCSYCRCNIFNRFLTCTTCIIPLESGEEDTYDICMECYAMGRSCRCLSKYKWVEQFPWQDLVNKHELWRHQIIGFEGGLSDTSPQSLHVERKALSKRTLAQVCQEQLKIRPWRDPTKEIPREVKEVDSEEDPTNADGTLKKRRKKRRSEKWLQDNVSCHICKDRHERWKLAFCDCGLAYCYGSLFRAFDLMPFTVMENPDWKCPHCLKICSAGSCRKVPGMKPFEPNGTILGHDTKKIADPRSVESLVNFSHSNISWVKKAGDDHPHETRRLRRRRDEAAKAKSRDPALDDNYVDEEDFSPVDKGISSPGIIYNHDVDMTIDPLLRSNDDTASETRHPIAAAVVGKVSQRDGLRNGKDSTAPAVDSHDEANRLQGNSGDSLVRSGVDSNQPVKLQPLTQFVAPQANMIETGMSNGNIHSIDANGITYHYPDPTLPLYTPPSQTPRHDEGNKFPQDSIQVQSGTKRKRSDSNFILQSDLLSQPKNDANEQFQKAQIQQTLQEARRNNRYISAEAAITGKQLQITLPINGTKLAAITGKSRATRRDSSSFGGDGPGDERPDTIIVQSDFPFVAHDVVPWSNGITKKKTVRMDSDEDFSARKPLNRLSSATQSALSNSSRKVLSRYKEVSSETEESDLILQSSIVKTRAGRTPRQLPAYLAERSDGDIADLPKELQSNPKQRRPRQKISKTSTKSSAVNKTYSKRDATDSGHKLRRKSKNNQPIDEFAAEIVPPSDPTADLSMLGPGAAIVELQGPAKQAEDNRIAKLRALNWAEEDDDNDDDDDELGSDGSSSYTMDEGRARPKSIPILTKSVLQQQYQSSPATFIAETPEPEAKTVVARSVGSMFSRPGMAGKKIKIVGAQSAGNGKAAAALADGRKVVGHVGVAGD